MIEGSRAFCSGLLLVLGAGCSAETAELRPILDIPPQGSEAYPFEGIDQLTLTIKKEGSAVAVAERTVSFDDDETNLSIEAVPFGDDWVVHLTGLAQTSEVAYGRTCPVSVLDGDGVVEPHLYFSRVVKWGLTAASIQETQAGALGYRLPDGGAIALGRSGPSPVSVFVPQDGVFRLLEAQTSLRHDGVIEPFLDGRAIIVGGHHDNGDAVTTVDVIDPSATSAALQVTMGSGPGVLGHTATQLQDGSIIVIGGRAQSGPGAAFVVTDAAWEFRSGDGGTIGPPRVLTNVLQTARSDHAATRVGDEVGADVLVIGGLDVADSAIAQTEVYRPLTDAFEALPNANLNVPRWDHFAIRLPGGFILVGGGLTGSVSTPAPVSTLEVYDPILGRFDLAGTLPAGAGVTDLSVTALPDGRVLLSGGLDDTGTATAVSLIARLDPLTGQIDVIPTDDLHEARAGHAATLLCDGTVLLTGGTTMTQLGDRYNPSSEGRR